MSGHGTGQRKLTCPRESVHSQSQTYAEISTGPETTASGAGGR